MATPALHQNSAGSIVLLDLPRSLEDAQKTHLRIRSITPLDRPWPSTEPKGAKLTQALASIDHAVLRHDQQLQQEIKAALKELRTSCDGPALLWCLSRSVSASSEGYYRCKVSRKSASSPHFDQSHDRLHESVPLILSPLINRFACLADLEATAVFNYADERSVIVLPDAAYYIPPSSCFLLATLKDGHAAFEAAASIVRARFDLILMDPPWANRSVRHGEAYSTAESQLGDPFLQTLYIVRKYLNSNGYLAIWVTNKIAVRTQVDQSCEQLGLQLCEEWVWSKLTSQGEPVTPLTGVWRKPYETLLVFKHEVVTAAPFRRFIFAVPDVHSRKPCLKRMFEEMLPPNYQALELFARNLIAGWWSWGDEVLKFQDSNEWTVRESADAQD